MEGSVIFPFKNSWDKQGKLRQTHSCAASLLPSPSHMSICPLGTLPTEKQHGRCSPHHSSYRCDLQGSKHQAGQVAALNWASPAPVQVPFSSGAAGEGRVHLRFKKRQNEWYLQKENWKGFP